MRRSWIHALCGLALFALSLTAAAESAQTRVTLVRWPYT